jgi:hypothetical protein
LIVALETPTQLIAAYVGNGSIWHIRGNFDETIGQSPLPWSSVNYLSPHSIAVKGRESLFNIVSAADGSQALPPTVVAIDKDQRFGDILVVCTDGIQSADQTLYGLDANGKGWLAVEPSLVLLHEELAAYFELRSAADPSQDLEEAMEGYLAKLKAGRLLEDDATLGVIVTPAALHYQDRKRN